MKLPSIFWDASPEEMTKGYAFVDGMFMCLLCCKSFGTNGGTEALEHVALEHGDMFEVLLGLEKEDNGLTAAQEEILRMIRSGESDADIVEAGLAGATSTVRGYRLNLREKERRSKAFLAVSLMLKEGGYRKRRPGRKPNGGWSIVDERFDITEEKKAKVLRTYFDSEKKVLKAFPAKQKQKIVILEELASRFSEGRTYTEEEVNTVLFRAFADISTLRRYLVEYRFLARVADGSAYWRSTPYHRQ